MSSSSTFTQFHKLIESEINNQSFGTQPKSLYEPIRYLMKLGGKRLRPMLVMLAYSLYKKDGEKIVSYAAAVEASSMASVCPNCFANKAKSATFSGLGKSCVL